MTDSLVKTAAKTISYILTHYIFKFLINLAFTRDISIALSIIGVVILFETCFYYIYERVWSKMLDAKEKIRTSTKTFIYITIHYMTQFCITLFFTQNLALSLSIIGVEILFETLYYYTHEKVWLKVSSGLKKRKLKKDSLLNQLR